MFRFQSPYFFLLLIPLFILAVAEFRRRPIGVMFSDVTLLRTLPKTFVQRMAVVVPWLFFVGVMLLIVALARPQWGKEEYRIRTEGIAMVMCVDRSGSMAAVDFMVDGKAVNRLEAVKKTFRAFVVGSVAGNGTSLPGRKDDMIGLLAFGGYVDSFCPLTLDHETLLEMLEQIQLPQPPAIGRDQVNRQQANEIIRFTEEEGMTAIGDALAQAVERLKDVKAKSKVIILLSDGEQTFGTLTPQEGAELAKTFGIRIYSIGIGTTGLVPIVGTDMFGRQVLTQQYMVIDETALKEMAETTGGLYFNAKNTQALQRIYAEIDKLEKTEHEGRRYTQYAEYYLWPLLVGIVLLLLHTVLVCTRFQRLP